MVYYSFWVVILPILVMSQIEPMFIFSRRVFIREASSRIYSPQVFAIGQLIGELPYNILVGIVYWVLMVSFLFAYLVQFLRAFVRSTPSDLARALRVPPAQASSFSLPSS